MARDFFTVESRMRSERRHMGGLEKSLDRARDNPPVLSVEVGFDSGAGTNRLIVLTAQRLELGDRANNLPERPAFREAIDMINKSLPDQLAAVARDNPPGVTLTYLQAKQLAIAIRDAVRESYLSFHGAELSASQKSRKQGTPYANKQLVGREGPRLVQHIVAIVNGKIVE